MKTHDLISERAQKSSEDAFLKAMSEVPTNGVIPGDSLQGKGSLTYRKSEDTISNVDLVDRLKKSITF